MSSKAVFALVALVALQVSQADATCNEKLTSGWRDKNHVGYRGCQTVTRSGKTCQAWSSLSPHHHTNTPENKPYAGLESNYCRNPDGEATIWCYTTDSNTRMEFCDPVPTEQSICDLPDEIEATSTWSNIYSPNHPYPYPENSDCSVRIHSADGVIQLNIVSIQMEEKFDYLYIYDGWDDNANLLYKSSKSHLSTLGSVTSSGSYLFLHFTTDGTTVKNGFHVQFKIGGISVKSGLCDSSPCVNGGTCYVIMGQDEYKCNCPSDKTGHNCEIATCNEELSGLGSSYRGCQTVTRSGKTCQAWSSLSPHYHGNTPEKKPNAGLESNYCRNPDAEPTIWCYTTDSNSRFEYCDPIPTGEIQHAAIVHAVEVHAAPALSVTNPPITVTLPTGVPIVHAAHAQSTLELTNGQVAPVESSACGATWIGLDMGKCNLNVDCYMNCARYEDTKKAALCYYAAWRIAFYTETIEPLFHSKMVYTSISEVMEVMVCHVPEERVVCNNPGMKVCHETLLEDCPVCYCSDHDYHDMEGLIELWAHDRSIWMIFDDLRRNGLQEHCP